MSKLPIEALADPSAYKHYDDILALTARMRKEKPVAYVNPDGYRPFWAVTKHDDIKFVEQNWDRFLAAPRSVIQPVAQEQASEKFFGSTQSQSSLPTMDGDLHKAYRQVALQFFMPRQVKQLAPQIEQAAKHYVDQMAAMDGACDFAADIAFYYPLRVITRLIGIPEEDEPRILKWTQQVFGSLDDEFSADGASGAEAFMQVLQELGGYFMALVQDRLQNPKDDIATVLANARINGEPMGPHELTSYFILMATAGHDTTSAALSGGLQALIEHPEQMAKLQANPDLLPGAVEEIVRWVAPVKHFMRTAAEDVEVGGQSIKKDDALALFYASACRDETIFENPDQFDIERAPNKHIAFGFGPHVCLGQHLARLELEHFLKELLPRLDHIELGGEPDMLEAIFVAGLKRLPVKFAFKS